MRERIAFIGGGNMASAIIGGLVRQGAAPSDLMVVEPSAKARLTLQENLKINAHSNPGDFLQQAALVVWAVKPQTFRAAALATQAHTPRALHLSVAAGIRSDDIARWLQTERVVRAMPNTPALIGKGISALFARAGVSAAEQSQISQVLAGTGELLWCAQETALDAVTALSGSGPAYVFYFLEAMCEAGVGMGLSAAQAHQLAVNTFIGAGELARTSDLSPATLRQQVTSQGGTTHAALTALENDGVKNKFIHAMQCARARAQELGDEFGRA